MRCQTDCAHPVCVAANQLISMDRTTRSLDFWRRARRWFYLPWSVAWCFAFWRWDVLGWLLVIGVHAIEQCISFLIERRLNNMVALLAFQASDSFANAIRGRADDLRKTAKVQTEQVATLN